MIQIIQGVFTLIFQLLESILSGISTLIISQVSTRRNESYNADFIPAHKILSKTNDGFYFGEYAVTQEQNFMHALVCGSSGSGKTTAVMLPSIYHSNVSLCIHDPSGELYTLSSGAKQIHGFDVLLMDYDNPEMSETYNPMDILFSKNEYKQLAKVLIGATLGDGGSNDKFWNSSAESITAFFIRYLKMYASKENQNLYNLATIINQFAGSPKLVDKLIIASNDDELIAEYKSFIAMDAKLLMNIVATAKAATSLFLDDKISQITNKSSFSFFDLRKRKTALYIKSDINNLKYYAPLTSIVIGQLFASMMKEIPKPTDISINCLIDEMPSMHLPMLSIAISNLRKFKVGLMCVVQTEAQIISNFGVENARNIIANCYSKIYLPGQPIETCRSLEILMGKFEFQNDEKQNKMKPLMSMDEIRVMSESILLIGNNRPIKLALVPFYKQKNLLKLSQIPPFMKEAKHVNNELSNILYDTK